MNRLKKLRQQRHLTLQELAETKELKEITSADQLVPGETYFLEQGDFIGCATFYETKPPKKIDGGPNVFVPNSEPLAYFDPLARVFKNRYDLFNACKEGNVQIYEDRTAMIEEL